MTGPIDQEAVNEALAAGARVGGYYRSSSILKPRDPYPSDERIAEFRHQVVTMLEELDGSMSVSELRELLEDSE